ncbi:leucyl/phenylalanyl-tRNA--protein transferase [Paracoccus jiaweipingae]|uniref:leucyl/phenylalanyl-tRNA--protein transferase n=1 Tax=unclassified Paracoccus (in: a-proteobacteria) TaxID=2688777 RepID=UPI0037A104FD
MLTARQMLAGYAAGVFPMADSADDPDLSWYDPPLRGVLPVGGVHASRSLRRSLRRGGWSASINRDFDAVLAGCADRPETWINAPLADLYRQLHAAGYTHSLEIWRDGALAGGLFGVTLGGAFFGESMFSRRSDASKLALLWLSQHLRARGFALCDTQFLTPHLASLGGQQISRDAYRARLAYSLTLSPAGFAAEVPDAESLLHDITQMS